MFLTHLMLSHNYCFPAVINFFPTDPSEMMDKGLPVSGVVVGRAHTMLVSNVRNEVLKACIVKC
jgi:hypothetical protein